MHLLPELAALLQGSPMNAEFASSKMRDQLNALLAVIPKECAQAAQAVFDVQLRSLNGRVAWNSDELQQAFHALSLKAKGDRRVATCLGHIVIGAKQAEDIKKTFASLNLYPGITKGCPVPSNGANIVFVNMSRNQEEVMSMQVDRKDNMARVAELLRAKFTRCTAQPKDLVFSIGGLVLKPTDSLDSVGILDGSVLDVVARPIKKDNKDGKDGSGCNSDSDNDSESDGDEEMDASSDEKSSSGTGKSSSSNSASSNATPEPDG